VACQQALTNISQRRYHGIVNYKDNKVIDLGLAVYGGNAKVMAVFGQGEVS
jgi:hypothetical protein